MALVRSRVLEGQLRIVALSPDGDLAAAFAERDDLVIVNVDTGVGVDRMTVAEEYAHGYWVHNTLVVAELFKLHVMHISETGNIQGHAVRRFNCYSRHITLSPCGKRVSFEYKRWFSPHSSGWRSLLKIPETAVCDIETLKDGSVRIHQTALLPNVSNVAWSPDGTTLAGFRERGRIVALFDTAHFRTPSAPFAQWGFLHMEEQMNGTFLCWSLDGTLIAAPIMSNSPVYGIAIFDRQGTLRRSYMHMRECFGWLDNNRIVMRKHMTLEIRNVATDVVDATIQQQHNYDFITCFGEFQIVATYARSDATEMTLYTPKQKWKPRLHAHFRCKFRDRVFAVLCCDVLPLELLFEIFELMLYSR